jgi:RNA polymerase sigma-70 factor (ECF subfamily)
MNKSTTSVQIWQQHCEKVKAFICSKVNGEDQCHDILHDVFLRIFENEEKIKLVEKPASYIIKMAQNLVMDYYRAQTKLRPQLPIQDAAIPEINTNIQLADCCLRAFIKKLPPLYSEALILVELEGLSQKDLAEVLDISHSGAKSRVQRARKMLKEQILACCTYRFDKYGNIISCCK